MLETCLNLQVCILWSNECSCASAAMTMTLCFMLIKHSSCFCKNYPLYLVKTKLSLRKSDKYFARLSTHAMFLFFKIVTAIVIAEAILKVNIFAFVSACM